MKRMTMIFIIVFAVSCLITPSLFAEDVAGTRRIDLGDEGDGVPGGSDPFVSDDWGADEEDGFGDPFDSDNDPLERIAAGEDNMGTTD